MVEHVDQFHVARLGADRVGLAEHLLGQEFELAARTFLFLHDFLKMAKVGRQANHFLGNVAALGENRHFTNKIITVDLHIQFAQQLFDAFMQPITERRHHLGDHCFDQAQMLGDGDQVVAHGYVGVYPEGGNYQFYANQLRSEERR